MYSFTAQAKSKKPRTKKKKKKQTAIKKIIQKKNKKNKKSTIDFMWRAESPEFRMLHFPSVEEADAALIRSPWYSKIPKKLFKRCTSKLIPGGKLLGICTKVSWKEGDVIGRYLGKPLTVKESEAISIKTRQNVRKWRIATDKWKARTGPKPKKTLAEVAAPAAYFFDVERLQNRVASKVDMVGMERISKSTGGDTFMPPVYWRLDGSDPDWGSWTRFINAAFPSETREANQNVRFIQYGEGLYVVAIKNIKKGQELVGWYGKNTNYIVHNSP